MNESVQKWLERNRPPRVKITYDVETGGAIEKRELPFVVGLFADLSGDRADQKNTLPGCGQRAMRSIDRDSFNDVMTQVSPTVLLSQVKRTLPVDPVSKLQLLEGYITFRSLGDFDPVSIVQAVPDLNELYRLRSNIRMLQTKAEVNSKLANALESLMTLDAAGKTARMPYAVLADPRPTATAADRAAALATARQALRTFATSFANAADTAGKAAAAKTFGFTGADDATNAALGREFIGLFSGANTPDNQRKAEDQLKALTTFAASAPAADAQTVATRNTIGTALGYPPAADGKTTTGQTTLSTDATALLGLLHPLPAGNAAADAAAQARIPDAQLAALVHLGLPELEDSGAIKSQDANGVTVSAPVLAEQKHRADSRWFADNMLLAAKPSAASATPAGTPPTLALTPEQQRAFTNIQQVIGLLDAAGLQSDDDRVAFLSPLGYFATDILASLDAPASAGRKPLGAALAIDQRVAGIDKDLSLQLRQIMHAPNFQQVEATWRGLSYLVSRAETGAMLKLYVFDATQKELLEDLDKAVDKDQSHLFKMIYESGYGTLGGEPYSLLVGGYEVSGSAQDIEFLSRMSEIAAAAHAPFITAASPALFGLDSFADLARPRDLEKIFEGVQLVGFHEFRKTEDSRYVTLVLPHVLLRLPYGAKSWPVDGIAFEENPDATSGRDFLWGNAAYMLAERITNAFSLYSWTAAIRGVEGGGLIEGLPLYSYPIYPANSDALQLFCPTEVAITDRREKELSDLGFIAVCHCKGTGTAAFFGGQTVNLPISYISDDANANARLSALLPYMLAASRFAHYIKVIMRDKIGSFLTRANVESYLNTWISQYVLLDENATQDAKASFPLSQANVVVTDVPGEPGSYNAVVFLRPHFQLEELTTSIRLVANLPAAG